MINIERKRIYKHTELEAKEAQRIVPLVESAFASELKRYTGNRQKIADEKKLLVSEQYANRARISRNLGVSPMNEDAEIFGNLNKNFKKFFEDAPQSIIGMGNVQNPGNGTDVSGGMWNSNYKPGSGDVPSYLFGLQNHIALNCIGFDLMPTIAVDTPKVVISYVDTVYGGGTFDDINYLPSYIEISSSVFARTWIKSKTLVRATTELIIKSNDDKALKVRFILGSTVKSAMTVEVLATGTCSTSIANVNTFTWDNSVTVKAVSDAVNASVGAKIFTSDFADDTLGTALPTLTIGYASAIRTNIAEAASNNNSIGGMNRAQQEKGPKHKLNVIVMDKQLEMLGLEIEADTSNIQIKDMAAMGVNVISHLYTGVQNQIVQSLDEVILTHLYKMGVQHALNVYKSQDYNYSLFIDTPTNTTLSIASLTDLTFNDMLGNDVKSDMGSITNSLVSSAYENQMTHGERLYSRILLILEFVAQQNRIAPPDFIVLGGTLASCLKKQSTFSPCPVASTLSANPELHYAGTIFETVNVYKNPKIDFNDPRILFGRRGDDKDPGAKFLAYDLAASRQTVAPDTMAEKIRVWSRFAIADVGFYPELNYYVGLFINKFGWA